MERWKDKRILSLVWKIDVSNLIQCEFKGTLSMMLISMVLQLWLLQVIAKESFLEDKKER